MDSLIPRTREEIAPGAVHVPDWLGLEEQRHLVRACREWARAGMRSPKLPTGGVMSVRTVCLGWHWIPYRYSKTLEDGTPVMPFPDWLADLGRRALADAYQRPADDYAPDVALINFYDENAKMGMHQDKDERSEAPVISLSLGDEAAFRFGNARTRTKPYRDLILTSGDLFVFGGPARFAYHGILRTTPRTAPNIGMRTGRLNITLRTSGLTPQE
ncbi:alkylated DNA repair protein (DNA oxidative demethylase) [Saccharopolyspora antimicrobica]|uniref:Alkylated DNA repair protein (DNA oxidative demethylase) n=1 Tax=Saccharopolyspora antimicrobica TaxID=455193 RepID=A0A1I4WPP0_9PSEU|nr:alpha-ketoglutarate-dependent dioxygenase AlkB [Saccharopolyspora antimicrobica]RKT83013.1 alkylated DNA repair protein (DNA oxidative demethylase) [Saccharopolyspora antimicrobica]SFN15781.1 alkylated DNA repair protein (DNA oxidative demethylase) [Saccharopolyspora antimicrobica]